MTKLIYRTRGNSEPGKKPRVYFSCHPDDFVKTFDVFCEDIFKTHDCVIYYKENMADELPEETFATDLGSMNLFVFPVTFNLIKEANLAIDTDLAFAQTERRPILPIMFEYDGGKSILQLYSKPELFGERQFIAKFSSDLTEISYADKLKKYLDATLIDDQTAEKIRKAFDAYIFLSYRKKDRKYANELMHLIHSDPLCRNIAIWFDEFLTPGESFEKSIDKAMRESKLFTLLVTPSLLEPDDKGEKNYVQREEYPRAKKSGIPILPAEKVETDRIALASDYHDLPEIVDVNDEEMFHSAFMDAVRNIAKCENHDDPLHNYLMGLAYLNGIDMEINVDYGVEYVTRAAEAELPEAMEQLYNMYMDGSYVALNYKKACFWAEKLYELYRNTLGMDTSKTLTWLSHFASACSLNGEYRKSFELGEKCYEAANKILGDEHIVTQIMLGHLAGYYYKLGDRKKANELGEQCYESRCRIFGKEHPETFNALSNLANHYSCLSDYRKATELVKQCYKAHCKMLGKEHPQTLNMLNNLVSCYLNLGDHRKADELGEQCYEAYCRILGNEHPDTLASLNNLALCYSNLGDYRRAAELGEQCYKAHCRILGNEHPDTIDVLEMLVFYYSDLDDYKKAAELEEQCYKARCRILGDEHPDTIDVLDILTFYYSQDGNYVKAAELAEKCYEVKCRVIGNEHPDTLDALDNLAFYYFKEGDYRKAVELEEQCYEVRCRVLEKKHPDTLRAFKNLQFFRSKI